MRYQLRLGGILVMAATSFGMPIPTAHANESVASTAGRAIPAAIEIDSSKCTVENLRSTIDPGSIGEPVSEVDLVGFKWIAAAEGNPAYCRVDGRMKPIDPEAPDINFAVAMPASWTHRAAQIGGGGDNGVIPDLDGGDRYTNGSLLAKGWVTLGSDSGHLKEDQTWALNDEAVKNFGYMQLKKTHDAAWEIIRRMYGTDPVYSYFLGSSQGGREALTVAQRYPADFDGIFARVPVVGFSTLQLANALRKIQETPERNWVTPQKVKAIQTEIMRQCDKMDGLADGVINNYQACRANFDPGVGSNTDPWAAKRCPDNTDPDPSDTSANACLTDGQIATLEFSYSPYKFATPLANGTKSFGMWVPSIDVVGPAQAPHIADQRYNGQEGAAPDAPMLSWAAAPKILGYIFKDLSANPVDYKEGGEMNARREITSAWLDSTDPDLSAFYNSGAKLLEESATGDTRASSGAQLDYVQAVYDTMGRDVVDRFARFWVMPQGNHGLGGKSFAETGDGKSNTVFDLPANFDRLSLLVNWVEKGIAPPEAPVVTNKEGRSLPLCPYPAYPHYDGKGPVGKSTSYQCKVNGQRDRACPEHAPAVEHSDRRRQFNPRRRKQQGGLFTHRLI